jgi:predicted flap endonuclease-1-like 5' DNA nuclease
MDHYKTNLLVQMRSLSNATLEHVQRFEDKFDKEGVDAKFKEATSMLTDEEEAVTEVAPVVEENIVAEIPSITNTVAEEVIVAEPTVSVEPVAETLVAEAPVAIAPIEEIIAEPVVIAEKITEPVIEVAAPIIEEVKEEAIAIEETIVATTVLPSSANNLVGNIVESKSNEPKTDELDIIEGIGPKIAMLLYDAGIFTFRDLAITPIYKIEEILVAAGPQFARHDPSTWTQQAKLAAEGRWDDLEALKGFLIRGKTPEPEEVEIAAAIPQAEPVVSLIETPVEIVAPVIIEEPKIEVPAIEATESRASFFEEIAAPVAAVVETPTAPVVENNLDSITEEMLEKVNKVKAAIRKAMVEKNDSPAKDNSPLPTVNDVVGKPSENTGGSSFFDNL